MDLVTTADEALESCKGSIESIELASLICLQSSVKGKEVLHLNMVSTDFNETVTEIKTCVSINMVTNLVILKNS